MERTPEIFDKIEAYLSNKLSREALVGFEKDMADDAELAREVALHRDLQTVLRDNEVLAFKEKVQKIGKEIHIGADEEPPAILNKPAKRFSYWKIAASVVFVIGLGALLWNNGSGDVDNKNLYASYYTPYPVDDTTRGTDKKDVDSILKMYSDGSYTTVIPELEKLVGVSDHKNLRLYLGNSYLNTNQEQKAILQFEGIDSGSIFYEDGQWYLALSYLKIGKTKKAIHALDGVIEYGGIHFKKASALRTALQKEE